MAVVGDAPDADEPGPVRIPRRRPAVVGAVEAAACRASHRVLRCRPNAPPSRPPLGFQRLPFAHLQVAILGADRLSDHSLRDRFEMLVQDCMQLPKFWPQRLIDVRRIRVSVDPGGRIAGPTSGARPQPLTIRRPTAAGAYYAVRFRLRGLEAARVSLAKVRRASLTARVSGKTAATSGSSNTTLVPCA